MLKLIKIGNKKTILGAYNCNYECGNKSALNNLTNKKKLNKVTICHFIQFFKGRTT